MNQNIFEFGTASRRFLTGNFLKSLRISVFALAAIATVCMPVKSDAQIGRSDWTAGIVFQCDNFVYDALGTLLTTLPGNLYSAFTENYEKSANFYRKNQFWIPQFRYRANVLQEIKNPYGKARIYPDHWGYGHMDWGLRSFSVGYRVSYIPRLFPLGFEAEVDYEHDGHKIRWGKDGDISKVTRQMVDAMVLLKVRLLNYDTHSVVPMIEAGPSYNYVFSYKDPEIHTADAVNSGFNIVAGAGVQFTDLHVALSLRYEHMLYDYYNKDFEYKNQKIFKDTKSKFGRLSLCVTYSY